MKPEILAVMALATWRIAVLFYFDRGPFSVFERIRFWAGVYQESPPFLGELLGCFFCVSVWAGLLCTIVGFLWWYALIPFALSGAALLLSGGGKVVLEEMEHG